MNRKGIFSALLAIAAVALVAAAIIVSTTSTANVSSADFSKQVLELKSEWNNARYLLDKTTSRALAGSVDEGCNFTLSASAINNSFLITKNSSFRDNCTYTATTTAVTTDITVSTKIKCTKSLSGFSASFEKDVTFKKRVDASSASGSCKITITDLQSGVIEIPQNP